MNTFLKKILFSLVLLSFVVTSCGDFGDINDDPNNTTVPVTSALLTNVLSGIGGYSYNTRSGLYCQYFSETQYPGVSLYDLPQVAWDGNYAGALRDLQTIIELNTDEATALTVSANGSNNNQIAVARILKAYFYSVITDRYGDVPYFEALTQSTTPAYDSQQSIYEDLVKELKEANAQFDSGTPVSGDVLLAGDNDSWKKFSNSIRMMLALRMSNSNPTMGAAEFNDALAAGTIESSSENVILSYPGGNFTNPVFNTYDGRSDFSISDRLQAELSVGFDDAIEDLRYWVFGQTVGGDAASFGGQLVAVPYGLNRDNVLAFTTANPDYSRIFHEDARAEASPMYIITSSDMNLARAEAAFRGWTTEDYELLYNDGIRASWAQWDIHDYTGTYGVGAIDGWFADHIAQPMRSLADGNELEKIITQRWLAYFPNGNQGWSLYRRTGFPTLVPAQDALNGSNGIPSRYVYPVAEPNLNPNGFNTAVSAMGGTDSQDAKMWWDQ